MPRRALEPSRSRVDDDGCDGTFHGFLISPLGFSPEEVFKGEGAASGSPVGPTPCGGAPGGTHAAMWCGGLVALLYLSFGLRIMTGEIRT